MTFFRFASIVLAVGFVNSVLADASVILTGEVKQPGTYLIKQGETFSQLITRAGGLTKTAYPYGAIFTRKQLEKQQQAYQKKSILELEQLLSKIKTTSHSDQSYYVQLDFLLSFLIDRLIKHPPIGRMVVESDPLVLGINPTLDFVLEDGDSLYVPKLHSNVMITGQVMSVGAVAHQPSFKLKNYIEQAGGTSPQSNHNMIFMIMPNGEIRQSSLSTWKTEKTPIPPGTTIYVSKKPFLFNWEDFGIDINQITINLELSIILEGLILSYATGTTPVMVQP